jgi:hypothetical protein
VRRRWPSVGGVFLVTKKRPVTVTSKHRDAIRASSVSVLQRVASRPNPLLEVFMSSIRLGAASLTAACLFAASPFVGTWKQNRSKSQFDSASDVYTIEPHGGGIRVVTFTGPLYGGAFDEKERPGLGILAGDRVKMKKLTDTSYEVTTRHGDKVIQREVVDVDDGGKKLIRRVTVYDRKDGEGTTNIYTYTRSGGDARPFPFVGAWTINRNQTKFGAEPIPFTIAEAGGVMTWSDPVTSEVVTIDLATNKVSLTGGRSDVTAETRLVDERTREFRLMRGNSRWTSVYSISPDGTTMTVRATMMGPDGKPRVNTFIYERQQ